MHQTTLTARPKTCQLTWVPVQPRPHMSAHLQCPYASHLKPKPIYAKHLPSLMLNRMYSSSVSQLTTKLDHNGGTVKLNNSNWTSPQFKKKKKSKRQSLNFFVNASLEQVDFWPPPPPPPSHQGSRSIKNAFIIITLWKARAPSCVPSKIININKYTISFD